MGSMRDVYMLRQWGREGGRGEGERDRVREGG